MNEATIIRVLQKYSMSPAAILPIQKGYRNQSHPVRLTDGRMVNLILYKNEPGIVTKIKNADAIADCAVVQGLPARQRAHPYIVGLHTKNQTRYAAIYTYLPGGTIPWEAYTRTHIKILGAGLSNLHAALADFNATPIKLPGTTSQNLALTRRMQYYFLDKNVSLALQKKLGLTISTTIFTHFLSVLEACGRLPDQQPLHMDFVRGNILFDQQKDNPVISGILDFEKTAYGHPILDIARTLAFLIVDCKYKPEEKVRKYFLQSGYNKRGLAHYKRFTWHRKDVLEELLTFFLFHDFYKFLRHNPYEALLWNEHFAKTRDVLRKRGIIS